MTRANLAHFFNWEKDDVAGVKAVPKLWVRGFDQLGANVVDETNLGEGVSFCDFVLYDLFILF